MRWAIFGAGAIGTWIGAALARSGQDATLVARGAHLEALRAQGGARLRDPDGREERIAVRAVGPDETSTVGEVDVVVLTVKAHGLLAAAPDVAPLLGSGTVLVAAQNGIPWWWWGHGRGGAPIEAVDPGGALSAALAPERALGAVVYLGGAVPEPGVVALHPEAGLVLGEPGGAPSERLERVAAGLERAGFPVRRTDAIRREVWTKMMGNASFNLMSVLTRAGIGTMATDPGVAPLVERTMADVLEVAGADRPQLSIAERLAISARLGDHKPSTLQDLEAGKRLELDALGAAVVELADRAGVEAPTLRAVYALADLQARRLGLR
jgi:2-dehydropantoate 2-reductase